MFGTNNVHCLESSTIVSDVIVINYLWFTISQNSLFNVMYEPY